MSNDMKITADDLCKMFNCKQDVLPGEFFTKINNTDTKYKIADVDEYKEFFFNVIKYLDNLGPARNTQENYEAFEKGWSENFESIMSNEISSESLIPKYVRTSKYLRFNKELIVTNNPTLEYDLFTLARYIIFSKYLSSYDDIYEFGCGSCQNLMMLSNMYPSKRLYGLDWSKSSVKIAEEIGKTQNLNINGYIFDMLNPPSNVSLEPNSAVFTIHALEQLGKNYKKFVSYLLESKPGVVLHYEPIREFYDSNHLLDYLAILHDSKRNYLFGYLIYLNQLQDQNKIEIIEARRTYLGGPLHESTSIIAWKPLD